MGTEYYLVFPRRKLAFIVGKLSGTEDWDEMKKALTELWDLMEENEDLAYEIPDKKVCNLTLRDLQFLTRILLNVRTIFSNFRASYLLVLLASMREEEWELKADWDWKPPKGWIVIDDWDWEVRMVK